MKVATGQLESDGETQVDLAVLDRTKKVEGTFPEAAEPRDGPVCDEPAARHLEAHNLDRAGGS